VSDIFTRQPSNIVPGEITHHLVLVHQNYAEAAIALLQSFPLGSVEHRLNTDTAGGVMQDTQNRGAYLRMTVPLAVRAAAAVLEEGEAGETGVQ
jgi:hypothetical protein